MFNVLKMAKNEAEKSPSYFKHGCVAMCRDKVVSRGFNKPFSSNFDKRHHIHAEIDAIRKINHKIIKEIVLFVVRVSKTGMFKNSEPCEKCKRMLKRKGFDRIFYTDQFGELVQLRIV